MDFTLTEEQLMIRQTARDYAQRELITDAIERDETCRFPAEHIKKLADLGFMGMLVDPAWQGSGLDTVSYVMAIEELSKIDPAVATIISVNNSLVCHGIEQFGTEEQKQKYLVPLANGDQIGAFLLSEPGAGSDASAQATIAADKNDHFIINGVKSWITNASSASIYLLFAQTDNKKGSKGICAFMVKKDSEGITLGPHENKMGMRSSDTHTVNFNDVRVPRKNMLGRPGDGFKIAMQILESGRIGIAAQALGIAGGAYEIAMNYANERKTFGTEIINHQAIAFKLADMAARIETSRLLCFKAAWLKDRGKPFGTASAMAKLVSSETAMWVTTEAVQILGGYGYVKEYHVERLMRDAKLTQIYEGTSEIQRLIIARSMRKNISDIFI